jgi:acyl-CoA hydrolase
MSPRRISPDELASVLPPGGLTLVSSCSAESSLLANAVLAASDALGDMTFCGVFVPGLNRRTWLANAQSRVLTFFMTPELRAEGQRVEFLPLCYQDILACLQARRPTAALLMCAPPDADGRCSFGAEVAFIAELWRDIPVRIAHINPSMPATAGDPGIPFSELTAFFEADLPLLVAPPAKPDPVAEAIASHIAPYVSDGATLQTGLGKIPDAVLSALRGRTGLRLHTGLIGEGALALVRSGALAEGPAAVVGVAIGSAELYDALDHPAFSFQPVSVTHGPGRLARIDNLVTINSALEVDLYGQAYAELTPSGLMSGPGGATDFARGARAAGGVRIVAMPSSAAGGRISRIVGPGCGSGPVSLSRMDLDVVVTEHGAADLRGRPYAWRAEALIAIAAPEHRGGLAAAWADAAVRL